MWGKHYWKYLILYEPTMLHIRKDDYQFRYKKIIYKEVYPDKLAWDMLKEAGVEEECYE